MSQIDVFCRLPARDAERPEHEKEILLDKRSVYVVAPLGFEPGEALLIIPKDHYESFAEAILADPAVAYDAAKAEQEIVTMYFGGCDYWVSESCGEVKGDSGRSQEHAHRWLINCSDGKNAAGMGVARLRDVVNFLPKQQVVHANAVYAERRGA